MLSLFVPGRPIPQGSVQAWRSADGRRARIAYSNATSLGMWRAAIVAHAAAAWGDSPPIEGPVLVRTTFYVEVPARFPRHRSHEWPHVRPDLDKYLRAVLDALTGTVLHDDAQVCKLEAAKVYGDRPGVGIIVESLPL